MSILCPSAQPSVRLLPLFSCDQTKINDSLEYEAIFHSGLDKLKTTIFAFGTNQTDQEWWPQWGGVTGVQMYFWKGSVESIARMLLLAHEAGLTSHAQDYKNCLDQILDYIVPRALSGDGTIGYTTSGGEYSFDGSRQPPYTRHAFLSMTRFMAFSGFAVEAIRICGATAAQESKFQSWATQLEPAILRFMDNLTVVCNPSFGGFSHMCTHPIAAACYWGDIGGYSFSSDITPHLQTTIDSYTQTGGNLGSDIGHDSDTMGNIQMLRDKQLMGGTQQPVITESLMAMIGDTMAARINSGENWPGASGVTPGFMYTYPYTKQFSQDMADITLPAVSSNYPNITNNTTSSHLVLNHFVSAASAAYGCATASDNEIC